MFNMMVAGPGRQSGGGGGLGVQTKEGTVSETLGFVVNGPAKYHSTGGREGVYQSYPRSSADSAPDRETDTTYAGVV